jgi:uncharacterized protein HemY
MTAPRLLERHKNRCVHVLYLTAYYPQPIMVWKSLYLYRLQLLMKKNPVDPKVYFTMGMLDMDRHDYKSAEKHIKKCLEVYLRLLQVKFS